MEARGLNAGQQVLVLTFSRMARAQLDREAEECLDPPDRQRVEVTNFHAFFQKYVFAYSEFLGLGFAPEIPCPSDWGTKLCESVPKLAKVRRGHDRDALMSCLEFPEDCVPPQLAKTHHGLLPDVRNAVLSLNSRGLVSQSDLAHHFVRLLRLSPFILRCLRRKYPFLILDEYQDSSDLQDALVRGLLGEQGKAVVMSDELQMIHEWRGASPERIANLKRDLSPCVEFRLEQLPRYEYAPELGRLFVDIRPNLRTEPFVADAPHVCTEVELTEAPVAKELRKRLEESDANKVAHERDKAHARSVLWHVLRLRKNGIGVGQTSLAVLFSGNDELRVCKIALRRKGVSVRELSSGNKQHDLVGLLFRVSGAAAPEERRQAVLRILAACALQAEIRQGLTWDDRLDALQRNPRLRIQGTRPDLRSEMRLDCLAETQSSFGDFLMRLTLAMEEQSSRLALDYDMFSILKKSAERAQVANDDELCQHLKDVMLQQQYLASTRTLRGTYVLNIHQAKGREFDYVLLPNVSRARFNASERADRNLFYVAITRARRRVFIYDRPDRSALLNLLSATGDYSSHALSQVPSDHGNY